MTEHMTDPKKEETFVDEFEQARLAGIEKVRAKIRAMEMRRKMRKAADESEKHSGGDGSIDYHMPDEKDD